MKSRFALHGIDFTTLAEPHGGQFAGTYGRYILPTKVEGLEDPQVAT